MNINFYNVKRKIADQIITGIVILNSDFFIFKPKSVKLNQLKIAVYRIAQTGYRKHFSLIPYIFYIKTSSGEVFYFRTLQSKKIVKLIESLIY